jgi:hypothetical protein
LGGHLVEVGLAGNDVEVVDDGDAPQVEQVLPGAGAAGADLTGALVRQHPVGS